MASGFKPDKYFNESSLGELAISQRRFVIQLQKLFRCLQQAVQSNNIALAFYQTPARQYLFYLEALSRIYRRIHNGNRFNRLRNSFKLLEDQLGEIDFYDGWINRYSSQKDFPSALMENFQQHKNEQVAILQKMLEKNKWLDRKLKMMNEIATELQGADWLKPTEDRRQISKMMDDELKQFEENYEDGSIDFHDIENGIHKFRRDIRWFSIYAQALDGLIQLKPVSSPDPELQPYLTPEIINLPYNKLPPPEENIEPVLIEAPNFYALSWLINELGILKDDGLSTKALVQAAIETKLSDEDHAAAFVLPFTRKNKYAFAEIPQQAKAITDKFLYDDRLLKRMRSDIKRSLKAS